MSEQESVIKIDFHPRPAQKIILDALEKHRFVTVIAHRRLGKTLLAIYYLIIKAIEGKPTNDARLFYFGISQKSAKLVSWNYFKKLLQPIKDYVTFRESELQIHFHHNGSIITLAGSENIESYRGVYIDYMVADEIASWTNPSYAYTEVIRPALSDRHGHSLFIGTVKGLDFLYDLYMKASPSNDWYSILLPVSVTKILPESEILDLQSTMSPDAYAREMECDFHAETPDTLMSPLLIDHAIQRPFVPHQEGKKVYFGLDVGRSGDPSVLYKRQGLNAEQLFEIHETNSITIANKVIYHIKREHPEAVFIDAGQGYGVIDQLQSRNYTNIVEVYFNSSSPLPNCYNLRSAIYYSLSKFLEHGSIPDDPVLRKELSNQLLMDDPNQRIRLVKKQDIRKILGHSPDHSDALALTFTDCIPDEFDEDIEEANILQFVTPPQPYDPLTYLQNLLT
jgi:hypothetical protein